MKASLLACVGLVLGLAGCAVQASVPGASFAAAAPAPYYRRPYGYAARPHYTRRYVVPPYARGRDCERGDY